MQMQLQDSWHDSNFNETMKVNNADDYRHDIINRDILSDVSKI